MVTPTFEEVTKTKPEKSLVEPLKKSGGRNANGRITSRHRGGGHKRAYRIIDFKRRKDDVPAKVIAIEYDPNRSARIALLQYRDGEKAYILSPVGLKVGDAVISGKECDIRPGNCMPFRSIPVGTTVHAVELSIGKGAQLGRSAGAAIQLMAKEGDYASLRLPSGEMRRTHIDCRATIGQVGNLDHENEASGKAGRSRWKGQRPHVRGVVMNPRDHPHGGGEGKSPIGKPGPVSPWGQPALGYKTRRNKRSNKLIQKRRK